MFGMFPTKEDWEKFSPKLGDRLEYLGSDRQDGLKRGAIGTITWVSEHFGPRASCYVDFNTKSPVSCRPPFDEFRRLDRANAPFHWGDWTVRPWDKLEYVGETNEWFTHGAIGQVLRRAGIPSPFELVDFGVGDLREIQPGNPRFRKIS